MSKQIYLNVPIKDLKRSTDFFTALGYTFNAQFTDENATAMVVSEDITIMLLVEKYYKTFMKNKEIADATKTNEMIIGVSAESREKVDEMVNKALELGGKPVNDKYDYDWMYGWSFEDLDGHVWEVIYIDESKAPASPE